MDTTDTKDSSPDGAPPPRQRRWPRRLAIGVVITCAVVGGALWFLGRESTLQLIAERAEDALGGRLALEGVTGSLYDEMHVERIVWRTPEQVVTASGVDIDWSPRRLLTSGVEVDKLQVDSVQVRTLKDKPEPSTLPASLAPPFPIAVADARVDRATFINQGQTTQIENIRLSLRGNGERWVLRDARASTPWGQAAARGTIGAERPFKLDAAATLVQSDAGTGGRPARLALEADGDLRTTVVEATGQAGRASGEARFVLSPYAEIPLRSLRIDARNLNPGFFGPSLPSADLSMTVVGSLDANRNITGSVNIVNDGAVGTLDEQRLPLRALRGQLGGDLATMRISDVLVDFGDAGELTGSGMVRRIDPDEGIGSASFTLRTDSLNLHQIHSSVRPTSIKGEITVATRDQVQTVVAELVDKGMRLAVRATLDDKVVRLERARLVAGSGYIQAEGSMSLTDRRAFTLAARANSFNPAALGNYPKADINATVQAQGALDPQWQVDAEFAVRRSTLLGEPLSGKGELSASAERISDIDARLELGRNQIVLEGGFGAPGSTLRWALDAPALSALNPELHGALSASGVVTGTMAEPHTTFEVDARGLSFVEPRDDTGGTVQAAGEAWLAGTDEERALRFTAKGSASRFDPSAFGAQIKGDLNGQFNVSGRAGEDWRGELDLAVRDSTLSGSPTWGHVRLDASPGRIANADVELHVGANVVSAEGGFGNPGQQLEWRIAAPQLAALGPGYAGELRGAGTLTGTTEAPALTAQLQGQNLELMDQYNIGTLRATANLGAGRSPRDPFTSDIEVLDYVSGDTTIEAVRLQTTGTRAEHTLRLTARGDKFDTLAELRGGWRGDAWNGMVNTLVNRGLYAFTLANPVPLRISTEPGAGIMGLTSPNQIALNNALIRLPQGTVRIDSLAKLGPRWNSRGTASGVPLDYLAQFSPALRQNVRGDLTLGAEWMLDLRTAAATGGVPNLDGMVRVFREGGDILAGTDNLVPLGLRELAARAEVEDGALRVTMDLEGARTGTAELEARALLLRGRLDEDSPLTLKAAANMPNIGWLAPLTGQPGLELNGALELAITGGGTIGSPKLDGRVVGNSLGIRWPQQGLRLSNGELLAQLEGQRLVLERLRFQGPQGNATAEGFVSFAGGAGDMRLTVEANKLEALSRPDRTVVVTGKATLVRDPNRYELQGNFLVNRALIELAPQGRPTMSDDVVVLGQGDPQKVTDEDVDQMPLMIDLVADLGDDFRLRGMGIDATLTGKLRMRKFGERPPRIVGTVRAIKGTYAAYGQRLAIERAILTFNGPYDNPVLDILAVRKQPEGEALTENNVEAGVQVRGTAQAPEAKLVSTPNVSDSEKLSWLVLGHGMEGTDTNEADILAAAAGALLGGKGGTGGFQEKLAGSLGVDEIGLRQAAGAAPGLEGTVVTVGKRISARAFLSFEQGATSASSLVRLRYKLTPRITLQFQTGTNTALDILYSWAFD